jgi:hypothetical protein
VIQTPFAHVTVDEWFLRPFKDLDEDTAVPVPDVDVMARFVPGSSHDILAVARKASGMPRRPADGILEPVGWEEVAERVAKEDTQCAVRGGCDEVSRVTQHGLVEDSPSGRIKRELANPRRGNLDALGDESGGRVDDEKQPSGGPGVDPRAAWRKDGAGQRAPRVSERTRRSTHFGTDSSPSMTSSSRFLVFVRRSTRTTSLQVSEARMILLFLGWNTAEATGASKRMVSTRDVEGPATGVCGRSDGVGNTERSHMIAVESSEDETRYRLFRDQLVSAGFDLGCAPYAADRPDVTLEHPGDASGLDIPHLHQAIQLAGREVVAGEWARRVETGARRGRRERRVDGVGVLLRERVCVREQGNSRALT